MPRYGGSFYKNVCSLLSSINSGICHRRPSVKLPLSKVGLELSQVLTNLGIISGFSVGQRLSRVHGHSRLWEGDSQGSDLSSAATATAHTAASYAGFPAMYITLQLNWDKHKPLYSNALLAAAPHSRSTTAVATPGFSQPMSLNSPTPEHVKIISKPSHQRWMSLEQLLAARGRAPPGIFLMSTHQGLLTDIDAELRGIGGILLGHLGLPLAHVVQLRGLLRAKHQQECAAAGQSQQAPMVSHVPLSVWDARAAAGQVVAARLEQLSRSAPAAGEAYMRQVVLGPTDTARQDRSAAAQAKLSQLRLQEMVWRHKQQQQPGSGSGSGGSEGGSNTRGGGARREHRRSGRGG